MKSFTAKVRILGVNPYVVPPAPVLKGLFGEAGRTTSPIAVRGKLDGKAFRQTLVRYQGRWRLYLNTPMRRSAGVDVGDTVKVEIGFDPAPRIEQTPPAFARALAKSKVAKAVFADLTPGRRKEILRYLNNLKTRETLLRNVGKVIAFLEGERPPKLAALSRV